MLTHTYTLFAFFVYIVTIVTTDASNHLTTEEVIRKISKDEQEASQLVQRAIIAASRKKTRTRLHSQNKLLALLNDNHFFVDKKKQHSNHKMTLAALHEKLHRKVKIPDLQFTEPAENYQEPRIGYHVFVSKNNVNPVKTKISPTYHDIERDVNKMLESAKKLKNESAVLQENANYLENEASVLKAQSENEEKIKKPKIIKNVKNFKSAQIKVKPQQVTTTNVMQGSPTQINGENRGNSVTAVITSDELFGVQPIATVQNRKIFKTDTTYVTTSDGTKVAFQDEPHEYIEPNGKITASVNHYPPQQMSPLATVDTVPSFTSHYHHAPQETILDNANNILMNYAVATEAPVVLPSREESPVVVQRLESTAVNHEPAVATTTDVAHHNHAGVVSTGHPDRLTAHVFQHPHHAADEVATHVDKDTGFPVTGFPVHSIEHNHHINHLKSGDHGQGPERGGSAARPELPVTHVVQPPRLTPGIPPVIPVETGYPVYHIPPSSDEAAIVDYIKPAPPITGINPYEILTSESLNGSAYKTHALPPAIPIVHHETKAVPVVQNFFGELQHIQKTYLRDFIRDAKKSALVASKRKPSSQISSKKKKQPIKKSLKKRSKTSSRHQGKKSYTKRVILNENQKAILKKWHSRKQKLLQKNKNATKRDIQREMKKFLKSKGHIKSRDKK